MSSSDINSDKRSSIHTRDCSDLPCRVSGLSEREPRIPNRIAALVQAVLFRIKGFGHVEHIMPTQNIELFVCFFLDQREEVLE